MNDTRSITRNSRNIFLSNTERGRERGISVYSQEYFNSETYLKGTDDEIDVQTVGSIRAH
jgi:hypothetical protein